MAGRRIRSHGLLLFAEPVVASASLSLDALGLASVASAPSRATAALSLADLAVVSEIAGPVVAAASFSLDDLLLASDSTLAITGTAAVAPLLTLAGAGSLPITGTASRASAIALASAGLVGVASIERWTIAGDTRVTAAGDIRVIAGNVLAAVLTVSLSVTLGTAGAVAITGTASAQPVAAGAAEGTVDLTGTVEGPFGPVLFYAEGDVGIDAESSFSLAVTLTAGGEQPILGSGELAVALGPVALVAEGAVPIGGIVEAIADLDAESLGQVGLSGVVLADLPPIRLDARAIRILLPFDPRLVVRVPLSTPFPIRRRPVLLPLYWFPKDPADIDLRGIDWSGDLSALSDSLSTVSWASAPAGLTVTSRPIAGAVTYAQLAGGTAGTVYRVTAQVTTAASRTLERSVEIVCEER